MGMCSAASIQSALAGIVRVRLLVRPVGSPDRYTWREGITDDLQSTQSIHHTPSRQTPGRSAHHA